MNNNNMTDLKETQLATKRHIFKKIFALHHQARIAKPDDIEDFNVNNSIAQQYRLLLSQWWELPCGLDFVPYNINKKHRHIFGTLSKIPTWM